MEFSNDKNCKPVIIGIVLWDCKLIWDNKKGRQDKKKNCSREIVGK